VVKAQIKNRPTFISKDGTVIKWLFLPSTVLTVSGSRGLWVSDFLIADLRLRLIPKAELKSGDEIQNHKSQIKKSPDSQPLQCGSPENFVCKDSLLQERRLCSCGLFIRRPLKTL
jgi:hypothetical protein